MLIHEDFELEAAAMQGELCITVPVSVYVPESGECEITAYRNVWDICKEWEKKYGDTILDKAAVSELFAAIAPVADSMGYTADVKESRVITEYRISELTSEISEYADSATAVNNAAETEGLECPLLHAPDPDPEDDEDICTVVIRDSKIVSCAGINDIADDDAIEIFVETAKNYRGQGYATASVAALVRHLTNHGYTVAYNCAESNTASSAIAEKLGMRLTGRRFSVVCYSK